VKAGKVRVLAVTSPQRSPMFPSAPTFRELGIQFGLNSWAGLVAPAELPDVMRRLEESLRKAVNGPDIAERLQSMGMLPRTSTSVELRPHSQRLRHLGKDAETGIQIH
jgi:tripartite-type tricarboxylate transporter receptor subunit TctC